MKAGVGNMIVLDCSVTLTWLFPDEATPATDAIAVSVSRNGARVPLLWHWEVSNALLTAIKKNRITQNEVPGILGKVKKLFIIPDMTTWESAMHRTFEIAHQFKLTAYDAAYLEMAQRFDLPLATLDKALADAARKSDVTVLH